MGKFSSNAKFYAKKSLAVFSAATLLLFGGTTGAVSAFTDSGITASAAETGAATITQLKLYDSNGNDITDNPIIYVDNNFASDGNVYESIKVVAKDANGNPVDDTIIAALTAGSDEHLLVRKSANEFTVRGGYSNGDNWVSIKAGDYSMTVASSNGEGMRRIPIKVYQPATEMTITQNGTKLNLNSGYTFLTPDQNNTVGALVIANHQYQYKATPTSGSTDITDWAVYEGFIDGDTVDPKPTTKAEITQNGLLTPKQNGLVTIVAKYKATETSDRAYFKGQRILRNEENKSVTEKNYQNGPKYIHVTIVKENPAKDLKITNSPGALELNDTFQLTYEATPTYSGDGYDFGATDEFRWESSNTKVAKVDATGMITAVGKGDATITIYGEGENIKASCVIRVLTKATSIKFNTQTVSTRVGRDTELTAIMSPTTADEEILWSSSDENIATVKAVNTGSFTNQQKAIITGVRKGTVQITARARNSGVEMHVTCSVADKIDSSAVSLTTEENGVVKEIAESDTIQVFDQHQITIKGELKATDGSTPDDTLIWEVLNNGENNGDYVQIISQNSKAITLKGFSKGTIQVKASSEANPSISKIFNLEVLKRATKGSILSKETETTNFKKSLNVGSTISLIAEITISSNQPYDHDDTIERWESSNTNVATVDNSGNVKIVGNGSTTISAVTASGYKTSVTIKGFTTSSIMIKNVTAGDPLPTATIKFNNKKEGTVTLGATVYNQDDSSVSDCPVTWISDDETIATVDSNGKVTGVALGETIITAKSGNKEDKCKVFVTYPLSNASSNITFKSSAEYSPIVTEYKPSVEVKNFDGEILVEDVDYRLEYSNNTQVGKQGTVKVIGLKYYAGTEASKTFSITTKSIKAADVIKSTIDEQELTAENKTIGVQPDITITHDGVTLVKDIDYTLSYSNNKVPGTAKVTISGKGNYKDSETKEFTIYCNHTKTTETITKQPTYDTQGEKTYTCELCGHKDKEVIPVLSRTSLVDCVVTLSASSFIENGSVQYPIVKTVKKGTVTLSENKDYTVDYQNKSSSTPGTYKITITGKNAYSGSKTVFYSIKQRTIASVTLTSTRFTYTGNAIITSVTVKDSTGVPVPSTGYNVFYSNNVKKGTAKVTVKGKGNYTGTITKTFTISAANLNKTRLSGVSASYKYTGKNITPTVSVAFGSKKLVKNTDYTVSYSSNKAIGTAKVTIKGKGNFTGTITKTFKIVPKTVTIKSVSSPKTKQLKVTWNADKTVTGYEILYSTSKTFRTGKKTSTISKNTTKTKTITGVTKGKTYYVKVRAYKTVSGKKVYGAYSSVKSVKIK